jgi:hypothetical protein
MHLSQALAQANSDADRRFIARGSGAGPEPLAELIAGWIAHRADMPTAGESLSAAVQAVRADDDSELSRDLRTFIESYFDGSMSHTAFNRCLNNPLRPLSGAPQPGSNPVRARPKPAGAIPVSGAESALRTMLRDAGLTLERLDPGGAWNTFVFAALPVDGIGDDDDDDMCLFECGVYGWHDGKGARFEWGFCRQFTLYDVDGAYDHMEQLRCDLFFEPTPQLVRLREDGLWSGPNLAEWRADVEARAGFRAVMGMAPVESRVKQSPV